MLLFGRSPNRVIEFACFDSKIQLARNTFKSKQAKRREYLPRAVSQNNIYLRFIRPTDNASTTNKFAIENKLFGQGTLSETNY